MTNLTEEEDALMFTPDPYQQKIRRAAEDALKQMRKLGRPMGLAIHIAAREFGVLKSDLAKHLNSRR